MEILFTIAAFLLFFFFMALGLMLKGQPLKGSCGGVAKLMGNEECEICGGNPNKCDEVNSENAKHNASQASDLAYDASKQ
jgi:hypothetical protein